MQFGFREPNARYEDDSIFNGTQLDDFVASAATDPASILVLGSGPGAVCFTLARALPDAERIDGVDTDPREIVLAGALRDYLDVPTVVFHESDAYGYLEKVRGGVRYDAILIDLFEGMDYSPLNFTHRFWRSVDQALADDGLVYVNLWGLPEHLDPLDGVTPVNDVISVVSQATTFDQFITLGHLRNTTVVFGRGPSIQKLAAAQRVKMAGNSTDALSSSALQMKLRSAEVGSPVPASNEIRPWTLERVQGEYSERLLRLADEVTSSPTRASLNNVLDSRDRSIQAIRKHARFRGFVSSTYHSDHVAARQDRLAWFPDWLAENWEWAVSEDPAWAFRSAAWHIASTGASLRNLTEAEQRFAVKTFPEIRTEI